MSKDPSTISFPLLRMRACGVEEHCQALRSMRGLSFWWYQGVDRPFGNSSLPFVDRGGNWWYQVKPGLCWPADMFRTINPWRALPAYSKSFLGYQHVVEDEGDANSHLVINAILDLGRYGPGAIDAKRRNAIRKGFKCCTIEVLSSFDKGVLEECRSAWNSLSSRTRWKHAVDKDFFARTWQRLLECPGVTILTGRDNATGELAGFLVTKIIGDTAYVDTIASRTTKLDLCVNDALLYAFLQNAAQLPGVTKAHFAIKSNVEHLERFKTSLGFAPHPFPTRTRLRPGVRWLLRSCFPAKYHRMVGEYKSPPADRQPTITPRQSELIKEAFIAAIGKAYQPRPLIGPKWFRTPQKGAEGFEFLGARKLAKAVKGTPEEVCRTIVENLDLTKMPVRVAVQKHSIHVQPAPQ